MQNEVKYPFWLGYMEISNDFIIFTMVISSSINSLFLIECYTGGGKGNSNYIHFCEPTFFLL